MFKFIRNIFKRKKKERVLIEDNLLNNEFYSILKLVSGEEILSLIIVDDNEDDPIVILQSPIIVKLVHNQQGTFLKVKPWIEMSNEDIFIMKMDKIMTMTEVKDQKLIQVYDNYNREEIDSNGDSIDVYTSSDKVKPSSKMGYISSVEDARKKLENLFKS